MSSWLTALERHEAFWSPQSPFATFREAIVLVLALSLPFLALLALVGLVMGVLQSAMSIQDAALSHLPKFIALVCCSLLLAPWVARNLIAFTERLWGAP